MLAQALTDYERTLCPGCGHPLHESMAQDLQMAWEVGPPHRCHACTAIADKAKGYRESPAPHALRFAANLPDSLRHARANQ